MLKVLLGLGRVSNLPTVWTNAMAGMWLAGGGSGWAMMLATSIALSLFYTGGMFLNDAFDRRVDAAERPERPIPSGQIRASTVFTLGGVQLALGFAILVLIAAAREAAFEPIIASGIVLAAAIISYDAAHHGKAIAPWIMGFCRAMVYVCAAATTGADPAWPPVLLAAAAIVPYTAGVTYVARVESAGHASARWPALLLLAAPVAVVTTVPPTPQSLALAFGSVIWILAAIRIATQSDSSVRDGVTRLIAGMSIVDAAWIAAAGAMSVAWIALAALPATRLLQRRIAGT